MHDPTFVSRQRFSLIPNYGYLRTPTAGNYRSNAITANADFFAAQSFRSMILWPVLFDAFPTWSHGLQGTGDCVSWMMAHQCDLSDAVRNHGNPRIAELLKTASEPFYAFGKCELSDSYNFHRPGMMGLDVILAGQRFGRLFRRKYESDDLSSYDGERAIKWGERPRVTHGVPDYLESYAAEHKISDYLEVTDVLSAAAYLEQGYPVGYCGETRWGIKTDAEGKSLDFDAGAHAMVLTGVQYSQKEPAYFWCANTGHGNHVSYPQSNGCMPDAYRSCGSWIPAAQVRNVLKSGDCFVINLHEDWNMHQLPSACFEPLSFF
jgi:hypothetical protein